MSKEILLTNGDAALVDDEDYEWLSQWSWSIRTKGKLRYAIRRQGKSGVVLMHRAILIPDQDLQVDHINGNGLDNRRENLRVCTNAENSRNRRVNKENKSSQYKGVSWDRITKKWRTHITIDGITRHIGRYTSEIDAATAYDEAARHHFGEFALINFPTGRR